MKNARDHFKVPQMADVQLAKLLILNTSTFVTTDAENFHYIGAIPDVMLNKVPVNNEIVEI